MDCLLPVTPPVNNRLLVVKFWGSKKLYLDFQPLERSVPLTPSFQGLTVNQKLSL